MDRDDVLLSVFVAVESAHAFSAFNPSVFTIRRFPDGQTIRDIRTGCVYAFVFSLAIGTLTSAIVKSGLPLLLAVLVATGMFAVYEKTAKEAMTNDTKD